MSFSHRHEHDEPNYAYDITGVAISNKTIILVSTLGFGALGLVFYFLILRRLNNETDLDEQQENARGRDVYGEMLDQSDVAKLNRAQRRARAKFRMKKNRRAAVPGQQAEGGADGEEVGAAAHGIGEGGAVRENAAVDNDMGEANLSRKERQKAAKVREREERKAYAEEAKKWRNKQQSPNNDSERVGSSPAAKEKKRLSLEEMFPRSANENDALSECLFWECIVENTKQKQNANPSDDIISIVEQLPKMTIREFIERLKQNGLVSIASLANEFGISIQQCLDELERINNQHGIVGISDGKGNFIYVSMEMIKEAIQIGNDAGVMFHPDRREAMKGDC